MATPNVTINTISGILAEFGPEKFVNTVNSTSPLIGSGALEKVPQDGEEIVVPADVGESPATTYAADFGTRPVGQTTTPVKARYVPAIVTSRLSLGKMSALAKMADKQLSEMLDYKLDSLAKSAARHVGRGLYGGQVNPQATFTWSGTAADSTVTVNFLDVSIFREGMAVDYVNATASLSYVVRVLNITPAAVGANSANVAGSVTFINDIINPATNAVVALANTTGLTTDTFALRGTFAGFGGSAVAITGRRLNNYDDIAGSGATASFGGIAPASLPGWQGQTLALAAAYSQEAMTQFGMRILQRSGEHFSHVLMNPLVATAHRIQAGSFGAVYGLTAQPTAQRPMTLTASSDKYGDTRGSGLELGGRPVVVDENCPATIVVFHNKDHVKLGVWQEMEPETLTENGGIVWTNPTTLSIDSHFTGAMQLYVGKRSAIGVVTGLTNM